MPLKTDESEPSWLRVFVASSDERSRLDVIDVANGTLEFETTLKVVFPQPCQARQAGARLEEVGQLFFVLRNVEAPDLLALRFADDAAAASASAFIELAAPQDSDCANVVQKFKERAQQRTDLVTTGFAEKDVKAAMRALGDGATKEQLINWVFDHVVEDAPSPKTDEKPLPPPPPVRPAHLMAVYNAPR